MLQMISNIVMRLPPLIYILDSWEEVEESSCYLATYNELLGGAFKVLHDNLSESVTLQDIQDLVRSCDGLVIRL